MSKLGRQIYTPKVFLTRPHLTEKSTDAATATQTAGPVYTFRVSSDANKPLIAKAFRALYGLKPSRINLIRVAARTVPGRGGRRRARIGRVPGFKKALIGLKPGEKIDFV